METVDNISQMIALRDFCREVLADSGLDMPVYEVAYPNKGLPAEFIVVKSIVQSCDERPISDGTAEICIYVANLSYSDDQSRPNLTRLKALTDVMAPRLRDASNSKVAFNDLRMTLVNDDGIRYFYQSIVINTASINL